MEPVFPYARHYRFCLLATRYVATIAVAVARNDIPIQKLLKNAMADATVANAAPVSDKNFNRELPCNWPRREPAGGTSRTS